MAPWGMLLVGDSDNNRIIECNPEDGSVISTYDYDPEWRVFQIVCTGGDRHQVCKTNTS